eukprot:TRINITY_DN7885_c0_g1_i1.p1 TRINITY_DN7885_c0_g1~~TRINITY_DN7885_c0_g1_i1.p1  ORF type:complete len:620 (+),score=86.90 TRINITY_DN7885_c0_g1_i1:122-1981(+)
MEPFDAVELSHGGVSELGSEADADESEQLDHYTPLTYFSFGPSATSPNAKTAAGTRGKSNSTSNASTPHSRTAVTTSRNLAKSLEELLTASLAGQLLTTLCGLAQPAIALSLAFGYWTSSPTQHRALWLALPPVAWLVGVLLGTVAVRHLRWGNARRTLLLWSGLLCLSVIALVVLHDWSSILCVAGLVPLGAAVAVAAAAGVVLSHHRDWQVDADVDADEDVDAGAIDFDVMVDGHHTINDGMGSTAHASVPYRAMHKRERKWSVRRIVSSGAWISGVCGVCCGLSVVANESEPVWVWIVHTGLLVITAIMAAVFVANMLRAPHPDRRIHPLFAGCRTIRSLLFPHRANHLAPMRLSRTPRPSAESTPSAMFASPPPPSPWTLSHFPPVVMMVALCSASLHTAIFAPLLVRYATSGVVAIGIFSALIFLATSLGAVLGQHFASSPPDFRKCWGLQKYVLGQVMMIVLVPLSYFSLITTISHDLFAWFMASFLVLAGFAVSTTMDACLIPFMIESLLPQQVKSARRIQVFAEIFGGIIGIAVVGLLLEFQGHYDASISPQDGNVQPNDLDQNMDSLSHALFYTLSGSWSLVCALWFFIYVMEGRPISGRNIGSFSASNI